MGASGALDPRHDTQNVAGFESGRKEIPGELESPSIGDLEELDDILRHVEHDELPALGVRGTVHGIHPVSLSHGPATFTGGADERRARWDTVQATCRPRTNGI